MEKCSYICIGVCVLIVGAFIYLLVAMESLEPLECGITYDKISKNVGDEVYDSGRYIISPFKNFIVYPARLVSLEFSESRTATSDPLLTRTVEGLALTLHISFQYKIQKENIKKLYALAGLNYQATYVRISRDILLKIAGNYNATSYWTDRQSIGDHMKDALDQELHKAYASIESLQLLRIDLPKSYEDSIVATQVELQKTAMRKYEQEAELIRQNISVLISEADQKIKVVDAQGKAEAYRLNQFATATTLNNTITTEANVYKTFQNDITLNEKELSNYLYVDSLMDKKDSKLLFGLQNTIVSFNTGPAQGGNLRKLSSEDNRTTNPVWKAPAVINKPLPKRTAKGY